MTDPPAPPPRLTNVCTNAPSIPIGFPSPAVEEVSKKRGGLVGSFYGPASPSPVLFFCFHAFPPRVAACVSLHVAFLPLLVDTFPRHDKRRLRLGMYKEFRMVRKTNTRTHLEVLVKGRRKPDRDAACLYKTFQALQEVEWRWHAMIQLATQLAAALSWWDRGQVGHWYLLATVGMKALVVGIVSMQRLDDKRLVRVQELFRTDEESCGRNAACFAQSH